MRKIIFILILGICSIGCSKPNVLEENFINGDNDFWVLYSQQNPQNISFWRFNKDKTSEMLFPDSKGKLKPFKRSFDTTMERNKWKVSSDSIFISGNDKGEIITSNKNVIVILGEEEKTHQKFHVFLVKENELTLREKLNSCSK